MERNLAIFSKVRFLVRGVAFDGLDQVGNQVVAAFELHVNIGPGGVGANAQLHQAVVHRDEEETE